MGIAAYVIEGASSYSVDGGLQLNGSLSFFSYYFGEGE